MCIYELQVPPVKQLQGMIWQLGYEAGALQGEVYADVPAALQRITSCSLHRVAIYSSGSRKAQRLLFKHSTAGDLTPHLSAYFDISTAGRKWEPAAYHQITESLGMEPADITFVTDVWAEAHAAKTAGMRVVVAVRPGNAPFIADHGFPTVTTFDDLSLDD
jgi:methylthioribulose 1-phosphate dehydratase/enolase-phosphatase E1